MIQQINMQIQTFCKAATARKGYQLFYMTLILNMSINAQKLHLLVSTIVIALVGLAYGLHPSYALPFIFDFNINSTDLKSILRATMGLYLAMAALWFAGIQNPKLWRTATLANVFFMFGLAFGRMLSSLMDGAPSMPFLIGLGVELVLGFWGLSNLMNYPKNSA